MLVFKLNHVSKRGYWRQMKLECKPRVRSTKALFIDLGVCEISAAKSTTCDSRKNFPESWNCGICFLFHQLDCRCQIYGSIVFNTLKGLQLMFWFNNRYFFLTFINLHITIYHSNTVSLCSHFHFHGPVSLKEQNLRNIIIIHISKSFHSKQFPISSLYMALVPGMMLDWHLNHDVLKYSGFPNWNICDVEILSFVFILTTVKSLI